MTQEQQKIWEYLTSNCVGIENVLNVSTIAHACGFNDYGTNNDDFRAIITDMVVNEKKQSVVVEMDILFSLQTKRSRRQLIG